MKVILFVLIALLVTPLFSQKRKIHLVPNQLIENKIDWPKIEMKDSVVRNKILVELIESKKVFLCHSGNISGKRNIKEFIKTHESNFHLVDLNADKIPELVFNGFDCNDLDNEFLYIYAKVDEQYEIIYTKKGNIIGYNVNPNTNETLLIHFAYPCCRNGTNNLNSLRLVNGKIVEFRKEFFAGRIDLMKGPFLPESIDRKGEIISTKKTVELRWSPEVVDTMAWEGTVQKNIILAYPAGAKFRVLSKQKNANGETWLFVLSRSQPILNKGYIVEPSNFTNTKVYGWIQEGEY